jgi:hypothetical protein
VRLYDMWNVAKEYAYAFKTINDVHNGNNGWYSSVSHYERPLKPTMKSQLLYPECHTDMLSRF